jgi:hypothetical protein
MKQINLNTFGEELKISKRSEKEKILSEEEIFIEIITKLDFCWGKSNKIYELFKISLLEYEEDYFQLIENLILLKYGEWKTEIILWYVFGRMDMDGKMYPLLMQDEDANEEVEIFIKTPSELWDFLNKLENKRK